MRVRLLNAVNLMSTLEGPQFELVPVEAVEGPKMAMFKKNRACQILQDWHKNMIRSVQPNNHWHRKMHSYTVIVCLHRSDHVFVPILKNLTRIFYFFRQTSNHFDNKSVFKGLKTGCKVSGMVYRLYLGSLECILIILMFRVWPFLAVFGRFLPFLPFLDVFGHF